MSKIIQMSTSAALMCGYFKGEKQFPKSFQGQNFGIGCSEGVNGELTIFEGCAYEGTAEESTRILPPNVKIPFIQITNFQATQNHIIHNVDHLNANVHLNKFIEIKNIFVALSFSGVLDKVLIRCPKREEKNNRTIEELHKSQFVHEYKKIKGTLVGFWTPEIFGRVSVPGFHFHFIDDDKKISGHVLEFSAKEVLLCFEEKQSIEITNPSNNTYKNMDLDVDKIDALIKRLER